MKPVYRDLNGITYTRWTVIGKEAVRSNGHKRWKCRCSCGSERMVEEKLLLSGHSRSCGCLQKEVVGSMNKSHGMAGSVEYRIWRGIITRCTNPANHSYKGYGAKGITVCDSWMSFAQFHDDMGDRPSPEHSIDRIDNTGPYSPQNCRWATREEQGRNKTNNRILSFRGKSMCVADWARELGCPKWKLYGRIYKGWSVERTLTEGF